MRWTLGSPNHRPTEEGFMWTGEMDHNLPCVRTSTHTEQCPYRLCVCRFGVSHVCGHIDIAVRVCWGIRALLLGCVLFWVYDAVIVIFHIKWWPAVSSLLLPFFRIPLPQLLPRRSNNKKQVRNVWTSETSQGTPEPNPARDQRRHGSSVGVCVQ